MDLSIIIVSWNVKEKLKKNLEKLLQSKGNLKFEIFIVDNNSSDNSVEMIKKKFPQAPLDEANYLTGQLKLIANQKNLGFAAANNQALCKAKGDFILLLNPDMEVMPDTLINMVNWMKENKQASIAGCNLIDQQDKTIQSIRRFPTIWDQLAIVLKLPHVFPKILRKYLRENFDYSKPSKVDSIRGGFFMVRNTRPVVHWCGTDRHWMSASKAMFRLDEQYFLWFEEVDFCKQVYQNKGEVWYTPVAKCVDYVGQSFKQVASIKTQKYFRDSMLKYFKKWHSIWQYCILRLAWPIGIFLAWIGGKAGFKRKAKT
ncbi:glycosyltransferase [Patescibacteria group bacterium]|nr:glycosyltransferase [Patescibacteria group bacterium]MBU2456793.1 glycosyltransferase [Patescibacteria group bacterium]